MSAFVPPNNCIDVDEGPNKAIGRAICISKLMLLQLHFITLPLNTNFTYDHNVYYDPRKIWFESMKCRLTYNNALVN